MVTKAYTHHTSYTLDRTRLLKDPYEICLDALYFYLLNNKNTPEAVTVSQYVLTLLSHNHNLILLLSQDNKLLPCDRMLIILTSLDNKLCFLALKKGYCFSKIKWGFHVLAQTKVCSPCQSIAHYLVIGEMITILIQELVRLLVHLTEKASTGHHRLPQYW